MEKMWLDVLYVMPTALPPHKQLHGDAAAADRLEMRLAFAGMDGVIVSDMEIRRGGRSYTKWTRCGRCTPTCTGMTGCSC